MRNLHNLFLVILIALGACSSGNEEQVAVVNLPATDSVNVFYTGNRAPLKPLHFIKLPIGSIQAGGWLLQYLELQRDGLTGHLGEISAWLEKKDNAWLSKDGSGDHGWEEVPYWLKGYGDLAYLLNDQQMIHETKIWINAVLKSQGEDGYFGPVILKNGKPDVWGNMIMLWCLQSYYEYSQDERVIPFMTRYFRWQLQQPDSLLLEDYWENSRGGDNLYSIYWLYNRTGDDWLLDLAEKMHRNTANWRQTDDLPNWHNVNIAQSFREPATYYMLSGDTADLKATYHDFHLVRDTYGQVPGGMFGADENAREGFTDPRQGVETCGMVEQMASDEMLIRFTGDPFWADHCEKVAFNTYPAAVMPDFKALRYITSPNMVVSDSKDHSPGIQNGGPFLMMNPFSSRCCQHNHAQGWPYYAENLWMATPDHGLAAILYSSSKVTARVGEGTEVTISEDTRYPFEEQISLRVQIPATTHFPLYLRIPSWTKNADVKINGEAIPAEPQASAYVRIARSWQDGDRITISFPMAVKVKVWEKNKNSVSVERGPLTYSLKIKENYQKMSSQKTAISDSKWQKDADPEKWPAFEIYPESAWNYALVLDEQQPEKSFEVVQKSWPKDNFPFTPASSPIEIQARGKRIPEWDIDDYGLVSVLPQSPVATDQPEEPITLIPMGAARLRISAFPVAE